MQDSDPTEISLNLICDYPVRWSKFKVLRDFLQNFYDAVGHREWHSRFSHVISGERLYFRVDGTGFDYEWLIHIGASTKRNEPGQYAGFFGEGFKIASLCALRDFGWQVEMASRDWELRVVTRGIRIEGRLLSALGYDLWKTPKIGNPETVLCLYPFHKRDFEVLQSALLSFFYEENPLLGGKIHSGPEVVIFTRSRMQKPAHFPLTTSETGSGDGIIFAGYQAMGSTSQPLVLCLHSYRQNDRERNFFFTMDVIKVIGEICRKIPPDVAIVLLEFFKRNWGEYPKGKYDFKTLYHSIGSLIRSVARSPDHRSVFRRRYPNLLVALNVKRNDMSACNRRRQARAWLRQQSDVRVLVQDGFFELGYEILENACERAGGFCQTRIPDHREKPLIDLLERITETILPAFFSPGTPPPCQIIMNEHAAWAGMAICVPLSTPIFNPQGLKIAYRLPMVAVKRDLFSRSFGDAWSCYLHERAHVFGPDSSAGFGKAMTEILKIVLNSQTLVSEFHHQWKAQAMRKTASPADIRLAM